ncbi:Cytochrome P450 superfamily [Arabidopsis thaliana x Arabidopsis arenosa]|uniref:Cytochrome P450 724B1 n=1 Tax=Arabidopsis thaliana x Arabidopsis arenosa TaxID=1240361 RepID=A0A8T1YWZ4_9BRAS|nr:Cytochrome P450 superfamily [Arabidopsis thaliana x Arabidopsis arenosa]
MLVLSIFLSLGLFFVSVLILYISISKENETKDHHSSLTGSMGWPFIGETVSFFKPHRSDSIGTFLQQRVSRYGKVFKSNICGGKAIVSCDQELNMFILQNEGKLFTSDYPKAMHDILGKYSLLLATGDIHRKLKNVIISFINLTKSKPDFLHCAENLSISILKSWKNCREVEFHKEVKMYTLSVMVNQLLSIKPENPARLYVLQDFLSYMKGFISLPIPLPGTGYTNAIKARKRLSARVMGMIKQREHEEEDMKNAIREEDFLDAIISNEDLNYEEKVSIVLDILLGGFETSATSLSLVVYFLAKSPNLLHKLKEEHEAIRAKKGDGELLSWEDYQKMEFTQCVMSEALRCGNIVKTVHRKATHDIKFKEYVIPKGWKVFPIFTAVHLDPSLHENPFEFNPMRWTDKAKMNKKTTAFGGGVRVCPGGELGKLQIAFFLHHLVLSYRWKIKSDEMPIAHPYVEFKRGMLLEIEPTS